MSITNSEQVPTINSAITPEFVNNIFSRYIFDKNQDNYIITIQGKPVCIDGRLVYPTKEKATKAFYNTFSWKTKYDLFRIIHPNTTDHYWSGRFTTERRLYWNEFKKEIANNYGFKIIKL